MDDINKSNFKLTLNIQKCGNQYVYCSGDCKQECSRRAYTDLPEGSYVITDISPYCKDYIPDFNIFKGAFNK